MDQFTAIGMAGNIVRFLDFGGKFLSGASELYNASEGTTSSNRILADITRDLQRLCDILTSRGHPKWGSAIDGSDALQEIAASCKSLGQEFLAMLDSLKVNHHSRWESARKALKNIWKEKEVQRCKRQLDLYRSQISSHVLVILSDRQEAMLNGHLQTLEIQTGGSPGIVERLIDSQRRLGIKISSEAAELKSMIMSALILEANDPKGRESANSSDARFPRDLGSRLTSLSTELEAIRKQVEIIKSLQFPRMFERESNVQTAHPGTYEWLFDRNNQALVEKSPSRVFDWLREGKGTFWISGKAGSGKSTLMKFFHNNPKTTAALHKWAAGRELLVAHFFFWNAGTSMQKNQLGLLQTLLFHILTRMPEVLPDVCPDRWEGVASGEPWTQKEVLQVFGKVREQLIDRTRFCFFIDGLDEYDGDHADIIEIINGLADTNYAKVCFSSRPWNVFERVYQENLGQKLRLQDLNQTDIAHFTREKLAEGSQLDANTWSYESLVQEIVDTADGVFLWVFLVVRSLRRGMTNLDTPVELQTRLRELPPDLESFFQQILNSCESVYHHQAARLYLIALAAASNGLHTTDVVYFAQEDPNFALREELVREYSHNKSQLVKNTVTRVLARCQDLLEFSRTGQLNFLHRTVKDFLETKEIQQQLKARAQSFSVHVFLCNSMLLQILAAVKHPGPCDPEPYSDFKRLLDYFWFYASEGEQADQNIHYLFPALDRAVWLLSHNEVTGADSSKSFEATAYCGFHYEGWLADNANDNGIRKFLCGKLGKHVEMINEEGYINKVPPLDVALRFMLAPSARLEEVTRLLNDGADPNESFQSDGTIWQLYLEYAVERSLASGSEIEYTIMRELLLHGADPNVGDEADYFLQILDAASFDKEATSGLENLRRSLVQKAVDKAASSG